MENKKESSFTTETIGRTITFKGSILKKACDFDPEVKRGIYHRFFEYIQSCLGTNDYNEYIIINEQVETTSFGTELLCLYGTLDMT